MEESYTLIENSYSAMRNKGDKEHPYPIGTQ